MQKLLVTGVDKFFKASNNCERKKVFEHLRRINALITFYFRLSWSPAGNVAEHFYPKDWRSTREAANVPGNLDHREVRQRLREVWRKSMIRHHAL